VDPIGHVVWIPFRSTKNLFHQAEETAHSAGKVGEERDLLEPSSKLSRVLGIHGRRDVDPHRLVPPRGSPVEVIVFPYVVFSFYFFFCILLFPLHQKVSLKKMTTLIFFLPVYQKSPCTFFVFCCFSLDKK